MSEEKKGRRDFLKKSLIAGAGAVAGAGLLKAIGSENPDANAETVEMVKVLSEDGELMEVPKNALKKHHHVWVDRVESRQGIPDRKFVMVVDLAKCANARKCVEECQKGHHLPPVQEFMKVYLIQEDDNTAPYWFPKPCFHCDKPQCVSVCPVGATYKRSDGIVLVDNERCIGCKFCMTGCPYSARVFAWKHYEEYDLNIPYSPEHSAPGREGTVSKCDFCPDLLRVGKLPYCASACPMGAIYFGDTNEDIVTNGASTERFTTLIKDRAGYRHLEDLGTEPNVYYLPPVNRQFPVERGYESLDEDMAKRYEDTDFVRNLNSESDE